MIIVTGDIHSNVIERFSYRQHPELRNLTKSDYIIVAGDFGCPWFNPKLECYDYWTRPGSEKEEHYKLNFLNNKPWKTIIVMGNHDNYDLIQNMPVITLGHAYVRQCYYDGVLYENIYYVDSPQFMYLQGIKLFLIPGAQSHDADIIFDWNDPNLKKKVKQAEKDRVWYRINHFTWWPQELTDEKSLNYLLTKISEVDYVISHDAPACVNEQWKPQGAPGRIRPTENQKVLQKVYDEINFKTWIHGHLHEPWASQRLIKTFCVYQNFFQLNTEANNDFLLSWF